MPRNKKNKGNSAPTPSTPNNNKAKSPADSKVIESAVAATVPVSLESESSNDDLKARLANAKERLHLLQEVIGGIGDPTDVENLKATGINAAKEKLNIIQDSVDSVKTTLLEVRQEAARSVTPEGSQSGTNKKRKNKKHQNQNPPQGFVVKEQPTTDIVEIKSKPEASENEGSVPEVDGTSTISKKKRNRNRNKNKKNQQEQAAASESLPQASNVSDETEAVKIEVKKVGEPQTETKENTPEANKSKNNKKNIKKGPQESNVSAETEAVKIEVKKVEEPQMKTKENTPEANKSKNNKKNNKKGPQELNVSAETEAVKIEVKKAEEPQTETKENTREVNKSKNNKQNNKKGQQVTPEEKAEPSNTVVADVKPAETSNAVEVKPSNQPPSNDKNKNKNKKGGNNNKDVEIGKESTEDQNKNITKTQAETNTLESKSDQALTDISKDKPTPKLTKEDPPTQKQDKKKAENVDQQPKAVKNEETAEVSSAPKDVPNIKDTTEPQRTDSPKNKKDQKKGQDANNKQSPIKAEETQPLTQAIDVSNVITAPQDDAKTADVKPTTEKVTITEKDKNENQAAKPEVNTEKEKDQSPAAKPEIKTKKEKNQSLAAKPETKAEKEQNPSPATKNDDKIEKIPVLPTTPVEEKIVSDSSHPQSQKNKKNKQPGPSKTSEKPVELLPIEQTIKLDTEKISSEQIVAAISKETTPTQCQDAAIQKESSNKNVADDLQPKSSEKELTPSLVHIDNKPKLDDKPETIKVECPKATVAADVNVKTEVPIAPCLPKLDFSQVVKDNKDKIPLMEIKPLPVVAAEAVVESKTADLVIKSVIEAPKPLDDVAEAIQGVKILTTVDSSSAFTAEVKPILDAVVKPTVGIALLTETPAPFEPKVNKPAPTDADSSAKQSKAKTPERKGNQANVKNEQKKPQQGQNTKQKQNDQKPQGNKKDEAKGKGNLKVDTESKSDVKVVVPEAVPEKVLSEKIVPEKVLTEKAVPEKAVPEKIVPEKVVETKLDSPAPSTEGKVKEEVTKKSENNKQEQGKPKSDQDSKQKEGPPKKDDTAGKKGKEPQVKDSKTEISASQSPPTGRQPPKQETKPEISKKELKKQNKMKGKAPQPPDIPMDMSVLSASMIDSAPTDEAISHEESEDQSSLISSDSKNVEGSGFVQSVDSPLKAIADETKSLESIEPAPKNENQVTEIERETKNTSPTSCKRNKDEANLKESVEMQETKRQEIPEKSAQQKLEPVQFPAVKLMDILEAKMTSPAVKPGTVAGNVRKLPKDTKRTDQLNIQQQKCRSKSPKENMAEKYVKNQKLASGDNKKPATQNLKNEILKAEVGALVTSTGKDKEVKELTKVDANLNESKITSGTQSTTTTEAEHVVNLNESDISKQKSEPVPKTSAVSDTKQQQPVVDDNKSATTNDGKPKIAPKPNVSSKNPPKVADRSKKSPVKTSGKESPTKETATPPKTPTPSNLNPQAKAPAKPTQQTKSQPKSQPAATAQKTEKSSSPPNNSQTTKKPEVPPKPNLPKVCPNKTPTPPTQDEDEEFVEYKFTPRPVFISTACQICKLPLDSPNPCKQCQMVSYCSDEHEKEDQPSHGPLCAAIQEIAKKRGGHIYNNARILNDDDYRSLRVHTLNLCENFLKRHLLPYEREILLFPRLCCTGSCREWRQQQLVECKQCGQVSYCAAHPGHLPPHHEKWCNSFNLYQKIVLRQKNFGRIEPSLPSKIMLKPFNLADNIDNVFKILYKNYGAIKDECIYATLTQLATAPLTALYGAQKNQQEIGEVYTIHLVGAELQFEADTLDKWETFFLHLVPTLVECRVVFIGPELNAENLPLEILSRIRMCRTCRQNCRIVKFDFQCGILYHDYANSPAFTKPDLICFFNPGLYRSTGFNGLDTWPNTIKSATSLNNPIVVTSYTEFEAPRDLERIQKESERQLTVVQSPHINPFASQRPERNFISDEIAPMIFKNFFCFSVK